MVYLLALLIGVVGGLRAMTALAAASWGAYIGWLVLDGSWLSFLASPWAAGITILLAIGELINDKLPTTPSRKTAAPFGARIVSGAVAGAAIGISGGTLVGGLVAGIVGAVIGTLGGYEARRRLALALGRDRPAAIIEDIVAVAGGLIIVSLA